MDDRSHTVVAQREDLIYAASPSGHREPYVALLASPLGMQGLIAPMTVRTFWRLVGARRLLCATLDDHMPSFAAIAALRSLLGRPTVALFLRFRQCVEPAKAVHWGKRWMFRGLRQLPGLSILTILPFWLDRRYALVAHHGVYDPQLWDMHNGLSVRTPGATDFSRNILSKAKGRPIVCILGSLSLLKGFGFFCETVAAYPKVFQQSLLVAAGRVSDDCRELAQRFEAAGGLLIDRRISDEELESLYGVADAVWSCYEPSYDQASGVFGRAVQFGVPVIVRRGSLLSRYSVRLNVSALEVEFGVRDEAAQAMTQTRTTELSGDAHTNHAAMVGTWRADFLATMERLLDGTAVRQASGAEFRAPTSS